MPTLQEAFLVGCHVTSTGIYFNQAVLAVDLSNHPEEDLQQQSTFWIEHLKEIGPNFAQIIQVSNYIATQSEISEISSPTTQKNILCGQTIYIKVLWNTSEKKILKDICICMVLQWER